MKTVFEEMGGEYIQQGDYMIPNFTLPQAEMNITLSRFGTAHKKWLKNKKTVLYNQLLLNATLFRHCKEVENRAVDMLETLMKQIAKAEGITEELKANDQMAWVGAMNNIRHNATEIVFWKVIRVYVP